jgi:hypothetical protein
MADEKQFFLGIQGQQTGPFSEKDVQDKIAAGEVTPDTLVWFEGLGEWQRIDSIAYFQSSFKPKKKASASVEVEHRVEKWEQREQPVALQPVFSPSEAVFFRRKGPRPVVALAGGALLVGMLVWYWAVNSEEGSLKVEPHLAEKKEHVTRFSRLQKAEADYLLNPLVIPPDYLALVREMPNDEFGRKATLSLETIFRKRERYRDLGELYALTGRFTESIVYFLKDGAFPEAEKTAFKAFEASTDPKQKRKFLIQSIELLTGPLQNIPLALARIQILEKSFPAEHHAFGYYLLSSEKKMADIFNRTSFFFVEGLVNHLKAEFPQIKLAGRPLVSLLKEGPDKFRIVGTYKGEVVLNRDKIPAIRFEYWMVGDEWNLVATNVTAERAAWAKTNRLRYVGSTLSSAEALSYLENLMHNRFPRLGLHERATKEALTEAARGTAAAR